MNEFVRILFYQWLPQIVAVGAGAALLLIVSLILKYFNNNNNN